ncbi:MAG: FG-GAP-like repeat-containing protein [Saprospiraceae bacterium]
MLNNTIWILACLIYVLPVSSFSQPVFENKTRLYKKYLPTRSVMPGGMYDVDGDLIDDLIIMDLGRVMRYVKSSGKHFSLSLVRSQSVSANKEWTLAGGDINNDGYPEILTAGEFGPITVTSLLPNQMTKTTLPGGIYAQASATADIDNDGWLDYFVCNDDGHSRIYMNNKAGGLTLTNIIDFAKNDPTDGSGNYGCEWTDVNGDLLPDLCISKCRAGVTDPTDLRRINRLYINKGNGIFEEKGAEFKLNSGEQTWVTTFGDIDNDGDMDAFVVNHYGPHALMENIDGQYFKEIPFAQKLNSFGFQAVMRDFDNDGWMDILMTGVEGSTFIHNKGNKKFEIIKSLIGPAQPRSMTVGDINDDGFLDVHAHMGDPINDIGPVDDELWLNKPNGNHFIKINLEGKTTNRSAIGTRVEIYGAFGMKVRYVKGGESYGIFNSLQQHVGLGAHDKVDSLVVRWPSGLVDKFTNPAVDQTYFVQENICMTVHTELYSDIQIRKSEMIDLSALDGYTSYQWNTGLTTKQIKADTGVYFVRMVDALGCVTISKPIVVASGCFSQSTKLINEGKKVKLCSGHTLQLSTMPASSYLWSNGNTSATIEVAKSGVWSLVAVDYCGNKAYDTIEVTIDPIIWNVRGDTIVKGQQARLISDLPLTSWFLKDDLISPVFVGDTLKTDPLEVNTTFFAKASAVIDQKVGRLGEKEFPLSNLFGANSTAGGQVFNVERPCTLHAIKVNTDTQGARKVIIINNSGDTVYQKIVFLTAGIQRVVLDAKLKADKLYTISTDTSFNVLSLGYRSPRLVRTFNGTAYPYVVDNVMTILSSTFGAVYYYYFYDWEINYDIVTCDSDLREVHVTVQSNSASENNNTAPIFHIYPNPATQLVYHSFDPKVNNVDVYDAQGIKLTHIVPLSSNTDVSLWTSGLYIFAIKTNGNTYFYKLIKH